MANNQPDTKITPVPPDEIKEGHLWRDWFKKIYILLKGVEHTEGHWYLNNGGRHAIEASAGVKKTTTTVANTTVETELYSYTFSVNEFNLDSMITATVSGSVSNVSSAPANDYTINVYMNGVLIHTFPRSGNKATNFGWEFRYFGTIRSIGTGGTYVDAGRFTEASLGYSSGTNTVHSIDTTKENIFSIKVLWGSASASNTISCTQGKITFSH